MKARTLLCGLALYAIGTTAQTEVNPYIPGATVEGVTYYLPRTALRLVVVAEKQVYTPGDFNKYADRYLRLSNVNPEPYTRWTIKSIEMAPYGVPDMQKAYSIVLKKRTVAPLVGLTRDGILLSINTEGEEEALPPVPKGTRGDVDRGSTLISHSGAGNGARPGAVGPLRSRTHILQLPPGPAFSR